MTKAVTALPSALRRAALPALAVAVLAGFPLALSAAVQWNEIPMPEGTAHFYETPFRTDTIDIPLEGNDGDLEYKLLMKTGDSIVYSWEVLGGENPDYFYAEFHGHTEPAGGTGDLMFYRKETGSAENGAFTAPFEGIHGWYLQNQNVAPVTVRLRVAGYYELVPDQLPAQ